MSSSSEFPAHHASYFFLCYLQRVLTAANPSFSDVQCSIPPTSQKSSCLDLPTLIQMHTTKQYKSVWIQSENNFLPLFWASGKFIFLPFKPSGFHNELFFLPHGFLLKSTHPVHEFLVNQITFRQHIDNLENK